MDKFSAEEINLMCIYDTSSRQNLRADLILGLNDIRDPEMREVFESSIEKLEAISDDEFSEMRFHIAEEYLEEESGIGE